MSQEKTYSKCIYCQTVLTNRNRSKEHVVNRSILPKYNNKLTLPGKVCKPCNEGFQDIDTAFVKDAIIGLNRTVMDMVNNEDRWDKTQKPFVIKNASATIRGDKQVFTVETNAENGKNLLRGIAKIALNALLYDLRGKRYQSVTDKQEKCHYICARNDDIFNGHEEELSDIKKFIKEGGESPVHITNKRIPLRIYDEDLNIEEGQIPMQNITDPTHIIAIYKVQSHYYAVISFFIGLDEWPPLYFVPLIGDINEVGINFDDPEEVRVYNFRYLIKKQPEPEPVTPGTMGIAEGGSAYIITPVNDPKVIHLINMSKNSSTLRKYLEREYRRMT